MPEIKKVRLIAELSKIRANMELDFKKAKQQLSNLINNLLQEIGVCF